MRNEHAIVCEAFADALTSTRAAALAEGVVAKRPWSLGDCSHAARHCAQVLEAAELERAADAAALCDVLAAGYDARKLPVLAAMAALCARAIREEAA